MAEFDLAKLMKQASESNDRERIEYINIQDIQADPHNFYIHDVGNNRKIPPEFQPLI